MKPLISDALKESLIGQLSHEKQNANIYLSIASFLNGKGLSNLAKKFEEQHSEETEHSLIIYNLLSDLGIVFNVPEVSEFIISITSPVSLGELYLSREFETTTSLAEIKNLAMDDNNPVVEERIREMIKLQQAEYEEATSLLDTLQLLNEWWQVVLYDASVGK